ncbi:MAG: type II CRISPR RNA-guided endonuclease Cas9 [Oscillospiraceae bacterium]
MRKVQNYDIGIDIGTNSVGYAVTDEDGELIRFKKENMWGVNLFESAETAVKTRGYRCTRRRYDRRKQRINLLQEFLAEDISQKDEYFYLRLKESSLWNDDKSERINDIAALFSEKDLSETKYYEKFPTIYHLRRYLIDTTQKEDIRLIYLALHHIVKYRGNFLYEDTPNISAKNSQIEPAINNLLISLKELYDIEDIENISKEVSKILSDIKIRNSQKSIIIRDCFNEFIAEKDVSTNIAKAMVGNVADFNKIFQLETEENLKISLAQDDSDKIIELLDDTQSVVFTELKKVYSAYILSQILKGDNTKYLSDAMIDIYDDHKKDLKVLKRLFKGYFKEEYYNMFRGEKEDNTYKKTKGKTYTNYILSSKDCTRTELCNKIRIILDSKKDELSNNNDYKYCIERLNSEVFLKKINSTDNGAIPFQLQMEEMKAIIENQSKYYECLKKNEDKLLSIVKFRIPYYVGPLNEKFNPINGQRKFAWATRIVQDKKIYPWNFEEIINIDDSAEKFIRRMTNRCTYLPEKDVIPKNSLLYSEFTVRNEIKQIKVNGIFWI